MPQVATPCPAAPQPGHPPCAHQAYAPLTNGKVERLIRTASRGSAYAYAYAPFDQCAVHLPYWLHRYNWRRPHASLHDQPPVSRLRLPVIELVS
ncbi:integrase core domain-containing protein [Algiphilus sp.]|uniref:integrase core domain-containing protein n=1 Tax=Algiphilus sp. TaxID=1872431 RepID=UPI0034147899